MIMRYRLLKNTNEFGETVYVIERDISMGSVKSWQYIFTDSNEQKARQAFAELKTRKTKILDFVDIDESDEPEQSAASVS